jgi:exopolysaccharide biosynthesis protein
MRSTSRHFILLAVVLAPTAFALAQPAGPQAVALTVNGRLIAEHTPALLIEGSLFVSSGVLNSELGVQVRTDKGQWRLQCYDQVLVLRPGERKVRLNEAEFEAPLAPLPRGEELYVPLQLLREPLHLTVTHEGRNWWVQSPATTILQVRQGAHPDRVRFVVDLTSPAGFRTYEEPGKVVIELPVRDAPPGMLRLHQFEDPLAEQVTESTQDGFVRLVFTHESPEPPQVFTLAEPARLVVDLLREEAKTPVVPKPPVIKPAPGDIWQVRQFLGAKGPTRGFLIRFSPTRTCWTLKPALAGDTILKRRTVTQIAARNDAYAAINGGFFAGNGPPLGMLMIDGEWIKAPLYGRAVLGITRDGQFRIANVDFDGRVEFEGLGMLPLDRLNEGHVSDNSVIAYTERWGHVVVGAPDKTRVAVNVEGIVVAVYGPNMDAPVPPGGYVLSGNGQRAQTLAGICQGTKAKLILETSPRWPDLWQALGGGPLLVVNGRACVNGNAERFRWDVTQGSHARSAVGLMANGDVILLAVEKPGLTLSELAGIMAKMKAGTAMNLDGGGSTAIVVGGRLLNVPGDGWERAVSNALLLVKS